MKKTRIILVVEGGVLHTVMSNTDDVEYILIDYDNIEADGCYDDLDSKTTDIPDFTRAVSELEPQIPDYVTDTMWELFTEGTGIGDHDVDALIAKRLKELNY